MGANVSSSLEKLLTLQKCDRKIAQFSREAKDLPVRKQQIESRLEAHRAALHQAQEQLKKHGLTTKELEGEIEGAKQKIAKFREQQFAVKNNEEYRALEREIAATEKQIVGLEDRELEVMEVAEGLQAAVGEKEKALAEEEADVQREIGKLDERVAAITAEVEKVKAGRPDLLEGIEPDWLRRYERVLEHVGDFAIVPVQSSSCGGCHMNLPPQIAHDARKGTVLTVCNYCGRILYCP
jgi:predicted  nucleic acid-binding Zn-ribbon protein